MAHDSYFVMFVFPLMLLDMVVQFMSIQIQKANGEQWWRHTIFHSTPISTNWTRLRKAKQMEQQLWSTNKYRCLWLRSLIYMSIQYSFHQRLLLDVRVLDSPTPFYFTIQFQCMHLLLFFVQNFQLFILLCSLCIAIFVRMNEERELCFDCELKFNQYNMARIFSPFECASCNEPPHTLILSVAFFTTHFGKSCFHHPNSCLSLSLHVAIQLQNRFGFLHLHEAHFLALTFSFSSKCRKKQ